MTTLNRVWKFRFLAAVLTWRYIQTRYSRTILGPIWVVLQPLLPTLLLTAVVSQVMPMGNHPYWKQTAAAMIVWSFYASIIDRSAQSLLQNEILITRVYFPRVLLPLSGASACLIDLAITLSVGALLITGGHVGWGILLLPLYCIPTFVAALGFSLIIGSSMIFVRDLKLAQPFLTQLGLYVAPILFPFAVIPAQLQPYIALNPLTFSILGVQASLGLGQYPTLNLTVLHACMSVVILIGAWTWFHYLEREIADQI